MQPLTVRILAMFVRREAVQNNAIPGKNNTLQLNMFSNIEIPASEFSQITLSGFQRSFFPGGGERTNIRFQTDILRPVKTLQLDGSVKVTLEWEPVRIFCPSASVRAVLNADKRTSRGASVRRSYRDSSILFEDASKQVTSELHGSKIDSSVLSRSRPARTLLESTDDSVFGSGKCDDVTAAFRLNLTSSVLHDARGGERGLKEALRQGYDIPAPGLLSPACHHVKFTIGSDDVDGIFLLLGPVNLNVVEDALRVLGCDNSTCSGQQVTLFDSSDTESVDYSGAAYDLASVFSGSAVEWAGSAMRFDFASTIRSSSPGPLEAFDFELAAVPCYRQIMQSEQGELFLELESIQAACLKTRIDISNVNKIDFILETAELEDTDEILLLGCSSCVGGDASCRVCNDVLARWRGKKSDSSQDAASYAVSWNGATIEVVVRIAAAQNRSVEVLATWIGSDELICSTTLLSNVSDAVELRHDYERGMCASWKIIPPSAVSVDMIVFNMSLQVTQRIEVSICNDLSCFDTTLVKKYSDAISINRPATDTFDPSHDLSVSGKALLVVFFSGERGANPSLTYFNAHYFSSAERAINVAEWSEEDEKLFLTMCATSAFEAASEYRMYFNLTNPEAASNSSQIMVYVCRFSLNRISAQIDFMHLDLEPNFSSNKFCFQKI
jgi:hypothetical protein